MTYDWDKVPMYEYRTSWEWAVIPGNLLTQRVLALLLDSPPTTFLQRARSRSIRGGKSIWSGMAISPFQSIRHARATATTK